MNAKMQWASLELERDNLQIQHKMEIHRLQKELMDTKEKLGEALNSAYEHERRNSELTLMIKLPDDLILKSEKSEKSAKSSKRSFFKLK